MHELAGKGDLEAFAHVSHRYVSGLDDESIRYTAESVRMLRAELERRSGKLKEVPREQRPDGSVTRELASKRSLRLRPIVCIVDELQNLTMHPQYGSEAAADIAYVVRMGRAYGIVFVLATQKPSAETVPTSISGNVTMRLCLKVPGQPENDAILGTGSYRAGYDAAAFRGKTDAGLGWLRSDADPQVVKTFYLDLPDTQRITQRARAMREAAGVLSGYALGQDDRELPRSFAADVVAVFGTDDKLRCSTIAGQARQFVPRRLSVDHGRRRRQPAPRPGRDRQEREGARRPAGTRLRACGRGGGDLVSVTNLLQPLTCGSGRGLLHDNALTWCYPVPAAGPETGRPRRRQLTTHPSSNTTERRRCPTSTRTTPTVCTPIPTARASRAVSTGKASPTATAQGWPQASRSAGPRAMPRVTATARPRQLRAGDLPC